MQFRGEPVETTAYKVTILVSATAISQSCEVSARFGADNGRTTDCSACVYPGFDDRIRDEDGLFVTLTVASLCGNGTLDPGEQCDQGASNGTVGSCCDAFCRAAPSSQVCRPAAGECDQIETCTGDVCDSRGECAHPPRDGASCEGTTCTCDDDGLFCNGLVRCGASLCIVLPPPCGEDDTCDEEHDTCVTPFGTATPMLNGTVTATPTPTVISGICAGDCNGNRMVVVNELVLGVNIALGNQPASACAAFDGNRDDRVAINELIAGVNNALAGCPT